MLRTLDAGRPTGISSPMNIPEAIMNGAEEAIGLVDQVRAMTWRLVHPRP